MAFSNARENPFLAASGSGRFPSHLVGMMIPNFLVMEGAGFLGEGVDDGRLAG